MQSSKTDPTSLASEAGCHTVHKGVLTNILLDLNDKVVLWILAAEGKALCFSRLDEQRGCLFSSDDVTGLPWRKWGPGLYRNGDAASLGQANLESFGKKEEKRSEQGDLGLQTCCPPLGWSWQGALSSRTTWFLFPGLRRGWCKMTAVSLPVGKNRALVGGPRQVSLAWFIHFSKTQKCYTISYMS